MADVSNIVLDGNDILSNYPNDFNTWMNQIIGNFKGSEITNPIIGMLWYNSNEDKLKLYNSAEVWKNLATEEFLNNKGYDTVLNVSSKYATKTALTDNIAYNSTTYETKVATTKSLALKLDKTATATNSLKLNGRVAGNVVNGVPYFSADGHLILPSGAEIW